MKFIVMFNTGAAIDRMPASRRDWERQLIDDFIRAIHLKQHECSDYKSLITRMEFIAGHGSNVIDWQEPENHVELDSPRYGAKVLPLRMYGLAQSYIDIEKKLNPLMNGAVFVSIPFNDFYDIRQDRPFKGCYIEIIPVKEETP